MAIDRVVSTLALNAEEERANWSLRPTRMDEYIGQAELIGRLRIAVEAARLRAEPLEHVLLHGPPGLGKTTLAYVIGAEMGTRVHLTSGPALTRPLDLVTALKQLQPGDILFIDEIHRTPVAVEEFVYPAMEDFRIDVTLDAGLHARTVQVPIAPFTLIGATTRAGLVSAPMRSRFGLTHHLTFYTRQDLLQILHRSARLLGMAPAPPNAAAADPGLEQALGLIADRSRGTPRIANRLLRRVRDYSTVRARGRLDGQVARAALDLEGVDPLGLDPLDRAYLTCIHRVYHGGPVGLEAIAATMNQDAGTLEDVVEPYLLQLGFLTRTRRGRMITRAATDHLGLPPVEGDPRAGQEGDALF
jgi:Holliday junction DNA helicase RuvB